MERGMYREQVIRLVAGLLVTIGVLLVLFWSRWWLLLPAFVGLNLFQSSLSGFCLLDNILKKLGVPDRLEAHKAAQARSGDGPQA